MKYFFIGKSIEEISSLAFHGCYSLKEFEVDNQNTHYCSIDGVIFSKDMKMLVLYPKGRYAEEYVVPEGVERISDHAFDDCERVERFNLPNSLQEIGDYAFYGCSMPSISIPEAVVSIGGNAFSYCYNLEALAIPNSMERIEGYLTNSCKNLSYVYIPESVNYFESNCFYGCDALTVINCRIKKIGKVEFYHYGDVIPKAFKGVPGDCTWRIPSGPLSNVEKYADMYRAQPWWVTTWKILIDGEPEPELMKGDANGDRTVDVADIVYTVDYIMEEPASDFNEEAADMDGDMIIDIADITLIVKTIMDVKVPAPANSRMMNPTEQLHLLGIGNGQYTLGMADAHQYVATQFDITMPTGMELINVSLNRSQRGNHHIIFTQAGDYKYRVVVYSLDNNTFTENENSLIDIQTNGGNDAISVENIMFVKKDGEKKYAALSSSHTTGISIIEAGNSEHCAYSIDGRKTKNEKLAKGLYIINGKKHIIK